MNSNTPKKGRSFSGLFIEPFRQFRFGLYIIGITVVFIGIAGWLFVSSFVQQYQHVMELFNIVDPELRRELVLDDVFYTNAIRLGVFFVAFLAVMFYTIFKLTHRYYGPLVAIKRFLSRLEGGDYSARVKIRKGDELQDLATHLNQVAARLEDQKP